MGYSVEVRRLTQEAQRSLYTYRRDGGDSGYFVLDLSSRTVFPSDEAGQATVTARIDIDTGDVDGNDLSPDARARVVEAAAGVIRAVRLDGQAPETAHRYFG